MPSQTHVCQGLQYRIYGEIPDNRRLFCCQVSQKLEAAVTPLCFNTVTALEMSMLVGTELDRV
jgi:hypothetical protein